MVPDVVLFKRGRSIQINVTINICLLEYCPHYLNSRIFTISPYYRNTFYKIFKWLLRKKIDKLSFKYSSDRNEANFIKYKTYRLISLVKKN